MNASPLNSRIPALLRDVRVLSAIAQIIAVFVVVALLGALFASILTNLAANNLSVESYDAKTGFACLLANEPLGKSKYRAGDPISVTKDKVEDWMIRRSDTEWEGGYTSELLKSRAENGK